MRAWRKEFEENGLAEWGKVKAGRGRKSAITDEQVAEIIRLTTQPGSTDGGDGVSVA